MEEQIESRENEPLNGYFRDLLQHFRADIHCRDEFPADDSDNIELNLGLSLGGCFGVDPRETRLVRSSTIAEIAIRRRDADSSSLASPSVGSELMRACSLPMETEEERRKRKEMQSLRRMEAKRKRREKLRNSRALAGRASLERNFDEDKRAPEEGLVSESLRGNVSVVSSGFQPRPQWSIGCQGSSSLGVSDFENRHDQVSISCAETRSPVCVQSLPERTEQKPTVTPAKSTASSERTVKPSGEDADNLSKKPGMDNGLAIEMGRNVMEEMPCVSTKVDGPNGRKIEGFLYKYREGEEVRIVCVCHGKFLSPAEFVKHAGGGDVAHPLRHIVVNPSPSSFL